MRSAIRARADLAFAADASCSEAPHASKALRRRSEQPWHHRRVVLRLCSGASWTRRTVAGTGPPQL